MERDESRCKILAGAEPGAPVVPAGPPFGRGRVRGPRFR